MKKRKVLRLVEFDDPSDVPNHFDGHWMDYDQFEGEIAARSLWEWIVENLEPKNFPEWPKRFRQNWEPFIEQMNAAIQAPDNLRKCTPYEIVNWDCAYHSYLVCELGMNVEAIILGGKNAARKKAVT